MDSRSARKACARSGARSGLQSRGRRCRRRFESRWCVLKEMQESLSYSDLRVGEVLTGCRRRAL